MNALVEIAGQQFEVASETMLNVPFLSGNVGDKVEFKNIFLTREGENINIGKPFINGSVSATIIEHGRNKKYWSSIKNDAKDTANSTDTALNLRVSKLMKSIYN